MEQTQNHTGMVWYNYNSVEGILASGAPVQVEIGTDIARHLNQQVQIQYGNFSTIPSQSQHIIVTHQPTQEVSAETEETHITKPQKQKSKNVSVGERVPCPECGKTFSCNANLRDHIRLHTGERPFSCSECGMSFAQRSNWRLHKRVHTGERPYMCGVCGKTFSRSSHLPGHMRVHTGERPFHCESCEHTFASAQALKNHVRTHTGEKPFVCDSCHTPFTHSSSLSSHKKRCNGEKRKRGRPLGSGRRTFKKKTPAGRRGRPKKRGKFVKRGRKKLKMEMTDETNLAKEKSIESIVVNGEENNSQSLIKFETPVISTQEMKTIPVEGEVMEISVEVINQVAPGKPDNSILNHEVVKPNESEGISILPDNGEVMMAEDMVQVAASAAGLNDPSDLHQEAAVTMAALQHGALNLVHHNVAHNEAFTQENSQTTTWYLKQE